MYKFCIEQILIDSESDLPLFPGEILKRGSINWVSSREPSEGEQGGSKNDGDL